MEIAEDMQLIIFSLFKAKFNETLKEFKNCSVPKYDKRTQEDLVS